MFISTHSHLLYSSAFPRRRIGRGNQNLPGIWRSSDFGRNRCRLWGEDECLANEPVELVEGKNIFCTTILVWPLIAKHTAMPNSCPCGSRLSRHSGNERTNLFKVSPHLRWFGKLAEGRDRSDGIVDEDLDSEWTFEMVAPTEKRRKRGDNISN